MIHGGKSCVSSPSAFSNDAKKLLICTGSTVSIFSTVTGMLITELEGHNALVTSVVVMPSTSKALCYCWTSALDGTVRYWDFAVPELMKMIDIRLPIFSMVIPHLVGKPEDDGGKPPNMFAYISVQDVSIRENKSRSMRWQIRKCNLTESRLAGGVILAETVQPAFITISPSGEFFGVQNKRTLYIWRVPAKDSERAFMKKMKLHHTKNLTTLAFHPNENIVAAGDVTGRILVWRAFGNRTLFMGDDLIDGRSTKNEDERPGVRGDDDADSCSTWHWHSAEVTFLFFSSDGAYLYSGGHEGVLVLWQLDTGKMKFLPRIGSPLLYFVDSPDPTLCAISCADNQVHLLKMPSLQILKSIAGIKLPCRYPDMWNGPSGGFVFDRSAGLVAIPAENYCIQFYSLFDNREISEVQVCERNHQHADEITVVVTLVALSVDGSMMSTAETRLPEEGMGGLVCLKFWASETQKEEFKLSTIVYEPHRDAAISAIAHRPNHQMFVSSSYGGDFKVWVCSNLSHQKSGVLENSGWICHAVGSYKKKPMTAAAFSADGTVLAVAAETLITLWDPDRNFLVAVIGATNTPIASISFIGNSEYLVSDSRGSRPELSVWSMARVSLAWSYKICVEAIACMEDGSSFAVLALKSAVPAESRASPSVDGVILLFNVGSPVPVAVWSVRKAVGGGLAYLKPNPSYGKFDTPAKQVESALLVYINSDHQYVIFDPYRKEAEKPISAYQNKVLEIDDPDRSGFRAMYGELPKFNPKRMTQAPVIPSERPWETIFSGPSHTLPPFTKLCSAFLESLLEKRTAVAN